MKLLDMNQLEMAISREDVVVMAKLVGPFGTLLTRLMLPGVIRKSTS